MANRKWYASPVVAGIVGVFAGGLTILLLESAGHVLFGTADPVDPSTITGPMFASVLVAWVVGCYVAGTVATLWTGSTSMTPGIVAGLVLLGGAVMNIIALPHPMWLVVAAFVLMPAAAFLAARSRVPRRA
jgi:hypothetical protein